MKSLLSISVCTALLTACASTPPDNSAIEEVATYEFTMAFNGSAIPTFKTSGTTYTQVDKQTSKGEIDFDNFMLGIFDSETHEITRIDKKLFWQINNDDGSYTQCPITGCVTVEWDKVFAQNNPDTEDDTSSPRYQEQDEQCKTELVKNEVKFTEKDDKRQIAYFDTQAYQFSWEFVVKDENNNLSTSTINISFWNSSNASDEQSRAIALQSAYQANLVSAYDNDYFATFIGANFSELLIKMLGNPDNDNPMIKLTHEMSKMKGIPLAMTFNWQADGEVCPAAKPQKEQEETPTDLSSLATSLAGNMLSDAFSDESEAKKEPIINIAYEVTSLKTEKIRMSQFEVPVDYELEEQ